MNNPVSIYPRFSLMVLVSNRQSLKNLNPEAFQQFQAFQAFLQHQNQGPTSVPTQGLPSICMLFFLSQFGGLLIDYLCLATQTIARDPGSPIASQIPPGPSQSSFPIQSMYQSARALPTLPTNPPSTSQPFLGFSALAAPSTTVLPTRNVNQARLASAAATNPRQQQVARRGTRRRISTRSQPTLAPRPVRAKIMDCRTETDPEVIRVQVRVYPPVVRCSPPLMLL